MFNAMKVNPAQWRHTTERPAFRIGSTHVWSVSTFCMACLFGAASVLASFMFIKGMHIHGITPAGLAVGLFLNAVLAIAAYKFFQSATTRFLVEDY